MGPLRTAEEAGLVCDALTSECVCCRRPEGVLLVATLAATMPGLSTAEHSTSPLANMMLGLPCACLAACSQGGAGLRARPGRSAAAQPASGGRLLR